MGQTKKEYIEEEFVKFTASIKEIKEIDIFPSLDDIDVADMLIFFNITFCNTNDYKPIVQHLIKINDVQLSPEEFASIFTIIEAYLNNLKTFLKTN